MIVCSQCSAEFPTSFRGENCTRCANKLPPRARRLSGFGLPTPGAAPNAPSGAPLVPGTGPSTPSATRAQSPSEDRWDLPEAATTSRPPEPSVFRAPTQPKSFGRPRIGSDNPALPGGLRTTMSIGVEEVQTRLAALRAAKESEARGAHGPHEAQGPHEAPTRPVNTRRLLDADMPHAITAPPGTRPIEHGSTPPAAPSSSALPAAPLVPRTPSSTPNPHKQTFVGATQPRPQGFSTPSIKRTFLGTASDVERAHRRGQIPEEPTHEAGDRSEESAIKNLATSSRRFKSTATFDPRAEPPATPTVPMRSSVPSGLQDFEEEDIATRRIQTGARASSIPAEPPRIQSPRVAELPAAALLPEVSPPEELEPPDPFARTVLAEPAPSSNSEVTEYVTSLPTEPNIPSTNSSALASAGVASPSDLTLRTSSVRFQPPVRALSPQGGASPPVLASEILREELVPREPGSRRLRYAVALSGALLLLAAPLSGLREPVTVGVWLVCGLLALGAGLGPLPYSVRALVTLGVALPGLSAELLSIPWASRPGAALSAMVLSALPPALLFRSDFRASRRARVFIALGVLAGLGWVLAPGAGGALRAGDGSWFLDHLGALLLSPLLFLSLLGFMGSNTTAGCKVWASMVVLWGASLPSLVLVNTDGRAEVLRPVVGHVMATGSLATLVAVSMASALAVYLRPSQPLSVLTPVE